MNDNIEQRPKLHLHVRSLYFEQIKAGIKTKEYRLFNQYWVERLAKAKTDTFSGIVIYNAYKSGDENKIEFPWSGYVLERITHPHFGSNQVTVFSIPLIRAKRALEMIAGGLPSRFVADSQIAEVALQADDEAGKEMK